MLFILFFIFIHNVYCFFPISLKFASHLESYTPSNYILQENQASSNVQLASVNKATTLANSTISIPLNPGIQLISTDSGNNAFYVNMTISNVTYSLILDTGSAYSWLYDSSCESDACNSKLLYPTSSEANSSSTQTFALAYGSETVTGALTSETAVSLSNLTINSLEFGVTDNVPSIFDDYPTSGILGLPSNESTSHGIINLIEDLYKSNQVSERVFTISLNNDTDFGGLFVIGSIMNELYEGNISYTPVISNNNSYWMCQVDDVYINSYQVVFNESVSFNGVGSNESRKAIIDSGTTAILLPTNDALLVHSFFENSVTDGENFAIYCNATAELNLEIGGQNFTLSNSDYLGEPYPSNSEYYGYCVSKLQGTSTIDYWVVGSVFMKKYLTVFDLDGDRLGFALQYKDLNFVTANSTNLPYEQSSSSSASSSSSSISSQSASSSVPSSSSSSSSNNSTTTSSKSSGTVNLTSSLNFLLCINLLVSLFIC